MKKMMLAIVALLTIAVEAKAMSYEQARNEALFLTDKMAYELNLTQEQYEAAYEINLDYLMSVTSRHDVFGTYWEWRNRDLSYILYSWQWDLFRAATYFYRPLYWDGGFWHFGIYARYPRRDYFYFGRPHFYATYRGAHGWRMNGGRSFYEAHRDHFRPAHAHPGNHVGMRNHFDRGDYRNGRPNSSTRITAPRDGGGRSGFQPQPNNGGGRSGFQPQPNNGGNRNQPSLGVQQNSLRGSGSNSNSGNFSGSRSGGTTPSRNSVGTTPSRSTGSGSFSGGRSGGSSPTRSGGSSVGAGSRSGGGNSGGARSGGSRSGSRR